MNPNETIIVIRSLVPGGVAQQDGQLIPGDRLLYVNDTDLENASLDEAVQALKGAPKGIVYIGVAKPHAVTPNDGEVPPESQASIFSFNPLKSRKLKLPSFDSPPFNHFQSPQPNPMSSLSRTISKLNLEFKKKKKKKKKNKQKSNNQLESNADDQRNFILSAFSFARYISC